MKMSRKKSFLRRYGKVFLLLFIFSVVAALALQFGPRYFYRTFGYLWLERVESRLNQAQMAAIQKGGGDLKAKIIWSSSRTGNHEIFLLTLPDLKMFQLTANKQVDFFPRFSPEGDQILFCRSQRPWVSGRDFDPWDIVLLSLDGNRERLVSKNGHWPQWITNSRISFVREKKVISKDLKTGHEEIILDATREPIKGWIETPEFFRRDPNLLAFTGRGKLSGVFILDRGRNAFKKIGDGCQITWHPDTGEVIWVDGGGNGGTQIFSSSITPVQQKVFMDLPGRYSHEYFPRFAQNGKWLVWGAAAEGHEHDIADYEIFLWQVGRPFSQAIRLTYNKANDNWPDIFIER